MKKVNKLLAIILAIIIVVSVAPITASAEVLSGSWGDNITWSIDLATKTVTFSGTGTIPSGYNLPSRGDFYKYHLVINEGITGIDYEAFLYDPVLSVEFPDTLTYIGASAFERAWLEEPVVIPDSVTYIGDSAFYQCYELTGVTIGDGVKTIGADAFRNCESLSKVELGKNVTSIGARAFLWCESLTNVYYGGTQEQFKAAVKTTGNGHLLNADIHFNCLGPDAYDVNIHEIVVTPPTCTEQGYATHITCECGKSYVDSYVDALGHEFSTPTYTAPPCVAKGYTIYECHCGASRLADFVDVTGHIDSDSDGACDQCNKSVGAASTNTPDTNTSGIFSIFNIIIEFLQQLLNSFNIINV